ncbi:transcription factor [Aspergillus sclerotialis]|uniref:Transcription factor n=1 Tax=Aspergillus sclerotialis TaxID=2070753 RepID=A0A3A2ZQQ6_9EURO|nr:transcription factor [Aspergillus sclerotialis]
MALSYASGLPADHTQTLPSFRELLPPHLHDEIEATSYFSSPHYQSRERPVSVSSDRELAFSPRSYPGGASYESSSKTTLGETAGNYSITPARTSGSSSRAIGAYGSSQARYGGNVSPTAAGSAPQYTPRGPSPILPSIRDLQSIPERGLNTSSHPFPETRNASRPEQFPAQDLGGHYSTVGGKPFMHNQPPYTYPTVAYQGDSEAPSHMMPHGQQSNFGMVGDPIDPKSKRRRGNLPKPVTDILRAWFHEHLDHPYPSEEDKQMFMTRTGLSISQISNWFINARRRQLPALRNQMRSGGSEADTQPHSPLSEEEQGLE